MGQIRQTINFKQRIEIRDFLADKFLPEKSPKGYIVYKGSWDDEKVAKQFHCSPGNVAYVRRTVYGRVDPGLMGLRVRRKKAADRKREEAKAQAAAYANGAAKPAPQPEPPKGDADARRKAFWAKFKAMQDTVEQVYGLVQGLESRLKFIEDDLGYSSKKDPEPLGIDAFENTLKQMLGPENK